MGNEGNDLAGYQRRFSALPAFEHGCAEPHRGGHAAKGHRLEVIPLQQPYRQQPSGAGAIKMILIDPETGTMHGGVSPAKDDYVLGW